MKSISLLALSATLLTAATSLAAWSGYESPVQRPQLLGLDASPRIRTAHSTTKAEGGQRIWRHCYSKQRCKFCTQICVKYAPNGKACQKWQRTNCWFAPAPPGAAIN